MHINVKVYNIICKKISNKSGAEILGLSLPEFLKIKKEVLKKMKLYRSNIYQYLESGYEPEESVKESFTNLEEGTTKLTGTSLMEPRSPEDIIKLLKIDTTKWKLSQYWNKEKKGYWHVSALISRLPFQEKEENRFLEQLEKIKVPLYKPTKIISHVFKENESVAAVLSLQDLHFGKPGNENMERLLFTCLDDLLSKAATNYHVEQLIFVVGGDLLNMDTFLGTTTKGTPVENAAPAQDVYLAAFEAMHKALQHAMTYTSNLTVLFIPGNHDRLSSYHLVHALSKSFQGVAGITFNVEYAERKVICYGTNMFCFEHGDVAKKDTPLVYATEFPRQWGNSLHRTLYTGHYHKKKTTEYITENEEHGFSIKILPSLSHTDYWHYHNKFTGNRRAGVLELHHDTYGRLAEFQHILRD